jgi:hypothetical protein
VNRAELLARIGRALNKNSTLDALTKARLLDALNNTHRQILSAPGCAALRRRQTQFTSVIGQARYALANAEAIKHIRDLANDRELTQRSLPVYRQFNPDPSTNQGTPDGFVPYGYEAVAQQPLTSGSVLFVASSFAGDTTQTVYIEGDGVPITAGLNGTTAVNLGTMSRVDKFYLSAATLGFVSLRMTSAAGPLLASIAPGQTQTRYLTFDLDPTPSEVLTYQVDAEYAITDMAQDTDVPQLPSDFHDVLETGAIVAELLHTDDNRLVVLQRQYDRRLGELKLRLARQQQDLGPRGSGSRYGAWFPNTPW